MIAPAQQPMQLNMWGDPEPLESLSPTARIRDDAPVPSERQLLWPADLVEHLGADLLERLYGFLMRRTRLRMDEVCRELRVDSEHVRRLIHAGSLDATDIRHPQATEHAYRVYRYSIVRWLFIRDFVEADSPRCNLPEEDLERIDRAVAAIRNKRRRSQSCGR
jgi:hypothetical protein